MDTINKEQAIRAIVASCVKTYATTFAGKHLSQKDNPNGIINMKIHNVFIAALGPEIQYYSALARSLDSSLGNMLETMAIEIARLNYPANEHCSEENVKTLFATAYNKFGRNAKTERKHLMQYFAEGELCGEKDFWNLVCNSPNGYEIVIDEFRKNAPLIVKCMKYLFGKSFMALENECSLDDFHLALLYPQTSRNRVYS